jgi:hypothetical protein
MEETTTIFVKDQGAVNLLIDKDRLIELLQNQEQFIIVKKKTTIVKEPWEGDGKNKIVIDKIAINKHYIIQTL